MIKFFSSKSIAVFLAVILCIALSRLPGIAWGYAPGTPRSGALIAFVTWINQYPWLSALLAFLLVLWQSFSLNQLTWRTGLNKSSGYLMALIYGLGTAFFPQNLYLGNLIIANSLFILGLGVMTSQTQKQGHSRNLFYVALLFGLASMLVPETYWLLVYLIMAVLVYKTIQIQDVLAICFGVAFPFFLLYGFHSILAPENSNWGVAKILLVEQMQLKPVNRSWSTSAPLFVALIPVLLGLIKGIGTYYQNNTETRRSLLMYALFTGFATLLFLFRLEVLPQFYMILAIPIAVYATPFLASFRKPWMGNLLLFLWVLLQQISLHMGHWPLMDTLWSWIFPS